MEEVATAVKNALNRGPTGPGMLGYIAIGFTVHYTTRFVLRVLGK